MSKQRIIKDEMWNDDWFWELDPSEKLMWVFLLTNPRSNIAGVYEASKSWIGVHTGFEKKVVDMLLDRFCKDGKIIVKDNWIILVNFHKHQSHNPKVESGVVRIIEELPEEIKDLLDFDRLSIAYPSLVELSKVELSKVEESKKEIPLRKEKKYLLNIPVEDVREFVSRFHINEKQLKSKAEDLNSWCDANGKRKKDYKQFLLVAVKKDFKEKTEEERSRRITRVKLNADGSPLVINGVVQMETVNS